MAAKRVSRSRRKSSKKRASSSSKSDSRPTKSRSSKEARSISTLWKVFVGHKIVFNIVVWTVVFVVSLIAVDYAVQYLNYHASVAVVNGERIYNGEFYKQLKQSYGQGVVSQLIDEKLIYQEAEKKNVNVSDKEIDEEIKTLEDNYGGKDVLNDELEARNMTREDLEKQVKTTLIVEKILGKDIEITEDQKKEFFEEYKDVLFTDNSDPSYEESEEEIERILREQEVSSRLQPWLLEIRDKSTIQNNVEKPKDYQFLRITRSFIDEIIDNYQNKDK